MAKRKRGGLALKRGMSKIPRRLSLIEELRERVKVITDYSTLQDRLVDDMKKRVYGMFSDLKVAELGPEKTKSPRIKGSVYDFVKSEAKRLDMDVHCYLATVSRLTRLYVKDDGFIDFADMYLMDSMEPDTNIYETQSIMALPDDSDVKRSYIEKVKESKKRIKEEAGKWA